jgi:hypothetical protein
MPTGNNWKLNVPTSVPYGFMLSPNIYSASGMPSVNPQTLKIGKTGTAKDIDTFGDKAGRLWDDILNFFGLGGDSSATNKNGSTIQGTIDEMGQLLWAMVALVLAVFLFKTFNTKK